jgi:PAS domain S-box-containing protein
MIFEKLHQVLPFQKLFKLILGMGIVLQLAVIPYNHFSGYHELADFNEFIFRFIRGVFYSSIAGFAIAYPDLHVILYLNKKLQWRKGVLKRLFIQTGIMLFIAVTVALLLTTFAHWVSNYRQGLQNVLLNNVLIYSVVNAFFMSVLEAWIYLDDSLKERVKAGELQKELIRVAANQARSEAQVKIEEEKNKHARNLIEQEKKLNQNLEAEISKREMITAELNERKEQLNSILSNLTGAAYRCYFDEQYTMKYISEKIFDISGYHASDLMGETEISYASLIHPGDQDLCRNIIQEATKANKNYDFEYRIIHKDGKIVWVNENGKAKINENGSVEYLDGIIVDVTRRKEAEIAAGESERNYKELMHFLPQPVFELDINGIILFNNKAGQEFFGLADPENSYEKRSALDFFIEEDIPRIIENIKKTTHYTENMPNEYTVKKPDGTLCPVLIFGAPIIRNNKVVGRRGIIVDISERKKQELKILQAKEELERINNTLEQSVAERTKQLTEANTQLLKVQKENLQSQFEVLKQQVNPHFLFNSLNVLTSLIKIDPDLAESFTERLSKVYRYVLENKEKDLVSLSTELEFLNAYLFLLEIRFMKKLLIEIKIDRIYHEYQILPLAIQLIIENAIKHNTFSKLQPLKIKVFVDEQHQLNIMNNLNVRETKLISTGVGLENINRRYALVSDQKPEFIKTTEHFIAKLPLLKSEIFETA